MDQFEEPNEMYGVPIEQFTSPHLLKQLDGEEVLFLRSLVMCKIYDLVEQDIDKAKIVASVILDECRGSNPASRSSAPK